LLKAFSKQLCKFGLCGCASCSPDHNTRSFGVVIFGSRPAYTVHDEFAKKKLVHFAACDNAVNEPGASYIRN